jgi:hypothetical protein
VKRGAKAETVETEVKRVENRAAENFIVNEYREKSVCSYTFIFLPIYLHIHTLAHRYLRHHLKKIPHTNTAKDWIPKTQDDERRNDVECQERFTL